MSDKDFNTLFPAPVTGLDIESLSIKASTASCNNLFSLFIITAGAFNCSICLNLLFLFIILLYKSFKSDAANLPPSKATKGLKSGGITGRTVNIIHSGLVFEFLNPSTTLSFLISLDLSISEDTDAISFCICFCSSSRFISSNNFLIAEAPISTFKSSPKPVLNFLTSASSNNIGVSGFENVFNIGISILKTSTFNLPSKGFKPSAFFLNSKNTFSFSVSKNSILIFLSGSETETSGFFSNAEARIFFNSDFCEPSTS